VARTGEKNENNVLVKRPGLISEDNTKMNLKARVREGVDWISVAEGSVKCRVLCEHDHELWGSVKCRTFCE
jgi:hypothetical protein